MIELKIDEDKEYAPFRLKKKEGKIRTVYSDHKSIILKMDILVMEMEKNQNACRRYMTEEGYEKYKQEISREKISTIWDKNISVQEKFNEWSLAVG